MVDALIVASRLPEDPPLTSAVYSVQDVVCEDRFFGYWAGLDAVWASDRTLVNIEHDVEHSDDLIAELLSCPHDLCAFPYKVAPFGWPGKTWGASYGTLWVTEGQPWAMFSSIGFCKISAAARAGTTLQKVVWDKVESSIHKAAVQNRRLWHLHWPSVTHHHDYSDIDHEAGSLYSLVKQARDEGRLIVHGDEFTDADLEVLKKHEPLLYDEPMRRRAETLCFD